MLGFQQELSVLHDLRLVYPDVEISTHHIDMRGRVPLRSGVCAIGIAEGDMYAGIFLILQDLADYVFEFNVRADGKLAHTIAVVVGMGIAPEVLFQFTVRGMGVDQAVAFDVNRQRILPQAAELRAEPVAYDAINHKRSVDFAWSRKHFAAG